MRAGIAWREVGELFRAGAQRAPSAAPFVDAAALQARAAAGPVVDAQGLQLAHAGGAPVLRGVDLRIAAGDRLLLQGRSGSGKSTLAALLTGLQQPQSGLLLLQGLDRPTLGDQWQALATAAPQFHENHVLSGTLAYNLLMGREWPPRAQSLQEAEALCRELGLGPLIDRMPAGLDQRIGETGWQLSHGERSRLFLARALLQRAPLTVLDESFAALDPATLARCLTVAQQRSNALLVIAHV
jgi:ATP-binding cassette subfamily B protein